jgi:xanthine dehydrogenase YagS FAD-binding subunit
MRPFEYVKPADIPTALRVASERPDSRFLGGGTNLVDLMREDIEQPSLLVDITGLPLGSVEVKPNGGIWVGALVRNSQLAGNRTVRERYPVVAEALLAGASPQIRNMATIGGNVLQRTRCPYFYDTAAACNKRTPGAGCDAIGGFNRSLAVLGTSDRCIATHPSDLCVALAVLDASVVIEGPDGARRTPLVDFHKLPGDTPDVETTILPGELITAIELPPSPVARNSHYRKVRDRASYAFALVSVAAALEVRVGTVSEVRLALGGVAPKPWRARTAEESLTGAPATEASFRRAADAELAAAKPRSHNTFKIELARRTIVAALSRLADRAVVR